jgi:hypothetical protein
MTTLKMPTQTLLQDGAINAVGSKTSQQALCMKE